MLPYRLNSDSAELESALTLIRECFAFMDGRIDPPSSVHALTLEKLADHAASDEIWCIGSPMHACVILSPRTDALYLGKLAVKHSQRRHGLSRVLVEHAVDRAKVLQLPKVELEVRVELVENLQAFARMGFSETGRTAHTGYDRPTSVTMQRDV